MPELPETETIARDLDAAVRGAVVSRVEVLRDDVLRDLPVAAWTTTLPGLAVQRVWRRAKLVVLDLGPADARLAHDVAEATDAQPPTRPNARPHAHAHLVVQPRFTGALLVDDGSLPAELRDYVCLRLTLRDGRTLHYRDVRRLGTVALQSPERFAAYTRELGPEPLAADTTPATLRERLGHGVRPLKAALMDQSRLAGVGNIYATEVCWAAALDPSRPGSSITDAEWQRVHDALVRILTASIAARGTSFRDYRDARGERGRYVEALQAYGRAGLPCPRCGHRLVGTDAIDGRMTVFCAWCQR
ncbi:MAG TPA: DNA-formamidopyrimidine glycosylase family protein [Gemmatimonadaceae bacterium]|nr:DNA-formamidopyrimidine glycosylase family protein [Gemmatimonadaceae bacterium]